ncbi:MAG: hypothetical protein HDQ87_09555 [Clostridia bacterium]|nr:hypothetical protein [Clostridia bacterium]
MAGGQILKLEAADKLEAAENRGRLEGERKGRLETILKLVHENLLTEAVGAEQLGMNQTDFQEAYNAAYAE